MIDAILRALTIATPADRRLFISIALSMVMFWAWVFSRT